MATTIFWFRRTGHPPISTYAAGCGRRFCTRVHSAPPYGLDSTAATLPVALSADADWDFALRFHLPGFPHPTPHTACSITDRQLKTRLQCPNSTSPPLQLNMDNEHTRAEQLFHGLAIPRLLAATSQCDGAGSEKRPAPLTSRVRLPRYGGAGRLTAAGSTAFTTTRFLCRAMDITGTLTARPVRTALPPATLPPPHCRLISTSVPHLPASDQCVPFEGGGHWTDTADGTCGGADGRLAERHPGQRGSDLNDGRRAVCA